MRPAYDPDPVKTASVAAATSGTDTWNHEPEPASFKDTIVAKDTPVASTVRHAHPVLLSLLLLLRFPALVADPVAEMLRALPVVTAIQVGYVLTVLPPAGSAAPKKKTKPGEKKKKEEGVSGVYTAFLALMLSLTAVIPLHVALVLFGAPAIELVRETALVAAHTSLMCIFPVFYTRGVDTAAWTTLAGLRAPMDEVVGGVVGCLLGAWLGAVPIPLDWDREWQTWPVTIVVGMWMGGVVGRGVGGFVGKRKTKTA